MTPYPLPLYGSAEAPQQGSTCCQPMRCNSFQSCSAASLRKCTRVLRSGGSPGIGIPVSTKTFGSLSQLFSSRWNRLVSLDDGSWRKPSEPMIFYWYMSTSLVRCTLDLSSPVACVLVKPSAWWDCNGFCTRAAP